MQPKTKRGRPAKPENMTIQKVLSMDVETEEIAIAACEQLGITLDEFAKRAFKYYAKSVRSKAIQRDADFSNIPTIELLNDVQYQSHPKRAEELTKRAIRAIKIYNESQGESRNKWAITPSIIHELIGSKPATIKAILANDPDISGYHFATFGSEEPRHTINRKGRKITDVLDLVKLVPDGFTE